MSTTGIFQFNSYEIIKEVRLKLTPNKKYKSMAISNQAINICCRVF